MFNTSIEREKGQYPISIGTSLALESFTGIHPELHYKPVPADKYTSIWFNVRTLFRNLMGSFPSDQVTKVSNTDLTTLLAKELNDIETILADYHIQPVFYIMDYQHLNQLNPESSLREDSTDKQKRYTLTMIDVLNKLLKFRNTSMSIENPRRIRVYKKLIHDGDSRDTLMVTHYAYDLLAYMQFKSLTLLETHTGKLKNREEWYTKYYNGNQLPEMPFRLDLLSLLGDNTVFKPSALAIRKALKELAQKYHWSAITSTSKIRENVRSLSDQELRQRILNCIQS